ncbi:hypothetical protein HYV73_02165 [Candidatus Uhrbacteria bacterium]|nr:hypothetical protein [Candidatus Uhrbacteria bacterium]
MSRLIPAHPFSWRLAFCLSLVVGFSFVSLAQAQETETPPDPSTAAQSAAGDSSSEKPAAEESTSTEEASGPEGFEEIFPLQEVPSPVQESVAGMADETAAGTEATDQPAQSETMQEPAVAESDASLDEEEAPSDAPLFSQQAVDMESLPPLVIPPAELGVYALDLDKVDLWSDADENPLDPLAMNIANPRAYVHGYNLRECVPSVFEATNTTAETRDLTFPIIFGHGDNGFIMIDDLEQITSPLLNPALAHKRNDFDYLTESIGTLTSVRDAAGAPVDVAVTGPFGGRNTDIEFTPKTHKGYRYYRVTLKNVLPGQKAFVPFCIRIGSDADKGKENYLLTFAEGAAKYILVPRAELRAHPDGSLRLRKTFVGSGTPSDFSFAVSPDAYGDVLFSIPEGEDSTLVDAMRIGEYRVTESGPAEYEFLRGEGEHCAFSEDGTLIATVFEGEETVCTFVNTLAELPWTPADAVRARVRTFVINDDGGESASEDFTLMAAGIGASLASVPDETSASQEVSFPGSASGTDVRVWPMSFEVEETDGPEGYAPFYAGACSMSELAPGSPIDCTVVNDDISEGADERIKLVILTEVTNDDGGSRLASGFTYNLANTEASKVVTGSETGTLDYLAAGSFSVTGDNLHGYAASFGDGCAGDAAPGDLRVCLVHLNDAKRGGGEGDPGVGTLMVHLTLVNDDGGEAEESDIGLTLDEEVVTSGSAKEVTEGTHTVGATVPEGYAVTFGEDCAEDGSVVVGGGEDKTCEVTVNDIEEEGGGGDGDGEPGVGSVRVELLITNDGEGQANESDFGLMLDGSPIAEGSTHEVAEGAHAVSVTAPEGYEVTYAKDCAEGGSLLVADGQSAVCEVNVNDIGEGGSGDGGGGGGGGGGGHRRGDRGPQTPAVPQGQVLGAADELPLEPPADSSGSVIVPPEPKVLGAAAELPRTGFPLAGFGFFSMIVLFGSLLSVRREE